MTPIVLVAALLLSGASVTPLRAATESMDFFETRIRPLLSDSCYECHGEQRQRAGLRLDSRTALLQGGDSGPAILPGKPDESLLIQAVRYTNEDLRMPPPKSGKARKLSEAQIADLTNWVKIGAPMPQDRAPADVSTRAKEHWAFQAPVSRPPGADGATGRPSNSAAHPIDAFIQSKLAAAALSPTPRASARTLIRRATYDLHGLPPTAEEVAAFEAESARDPGAAFANLVERLLASPRYGERWGRYWLDVARYADTKGYVYGDREDHRYAHSHTYRDWVIRAFNEDMPYDLFVKLQIAADQVLEQQGNPTPARDEKSAGGGSSQPGFRRANSGDLAAMGFLTLGRRFLGVSHDIIDDRIDVLTRGLQGLTVACARCHDHKYDPIPTRDYYSLYGVFDSTTERFVSLVSASTRTAAQAAFEKELAARTQKFEAAYQKAREDVAERLRRRTADYLVAQLDVKKLPNEEFYEILDADQLNPIFVRRWHSYLQETAKEFHPVFAPWHAFAALPDAEFEQQAPAAWAQLMAGAGSRLNPLVREAFEAASPRSIKEVAARYGSLFEGVREFKPEAVASSRQALDAAARAGLHAVLHAPEAPVYPPMGSLTDTQFYFDEGTRVNLGKLWKAIEEWLVTAEGAIPHAGILQDREPRTPRVFKRGNPGNRGEEVPRQYLEVIAGSERTPFVNGSGRVEMAQLIASRANPLTARVMVNRVWMHHFGSGLVKTPSDFGTRCEPPTHPELLDYLAIWFMDHGWSLKQLHRFILASEAYQRSADLQGANPAARSVDPENALLWRQNRRRLDFEALRDSLLAASRELDLAMGGKAVDLFERPFALRRAVYGYIDRQFFPGTLRAFDFANPDLHIPQRHQTTVPQQALFLLNSSFVVERAQALAGETASLPSTERVQALFKRAFQRQPGPAEVARALEFVAAAAGEPEPPPPPPKPSAWQYGYGTIDPASGTVASFTPLPHFEKNSWQGGPSWPDTMLGWLRLTAEGGHPEGKGRAVVRRWVAPYACTVKVGGQLVHEAKQGDGIRGTLASSTRGQLASWSVHTQKAATALEDIELKEGEWLDFIVDARATLSHDDFKWAPVITVVQDRDKQRAAGLAVEWNANKDFGGPPPAPPQPLDGWAALVQALLVSNEFVFVD